MRSAPARATATLLWSLLSLFEELMQGSVLQNCSSFVGHMLFTEQDGGCMPQGMQWVSEAWHAQKRGYRESLISIRDEYWKKRCSKHTGHADRTC